MLKYERTDENEILEFDGKLLELVAESTYMVRRIYNAVAEKDPQGADAYKDMMIRCVGDAQSPVWDSFDTPEPAEEVRLKKEKVKELLKELLR